MPQLMEELKNGYWKEAKARKAREIGASSPLSTSSVIQAPPAIVEMAGMASMPEPPKSIHTPQPQQPPSSMMANRMANGELGQMADMLLQQRQAEQKDRELQLMMLRQRVAQEQQEMEELLALRQQMAMIQAQRGYGGAAPAPSPSDLLLHLQMLQQERAQSYSANSFSPSSNNHTDHNGLH